MQRRTLLPLSLIVATALILAALGTQLQAQSTTDGAIGGTAYDAGQALVPGAAVTVRNEATNAEQKTTTDSQGYFRVTRLQPGPYTVVIKAPGFSEFRATGLAVNVGSLTPLDPRLTVGGSTQVVEVSGEAPQIKTESSEISSVLNQTSINNLPINGGRWSSFTLLTPGVVSNASGFGLVSFRGISELLNNVTVDGADNNQGFFSEERGRTRAGYSTAQVSVQEFQVNTSNYSSEYGRSAGGVVNTVTKSGGNTLHGQLFFYDRDNGWGATNPFTTLSSSSKDANGNVIVNTSPYKPKDWRKRWGLGVGGPIIKDKLFWFYAYDQYKRNFPGTAQPGNPGAFFAPLTAPQLAAFQQQLGGVSPAVAQGYFNQGITDLLGVLGPVPRTGDQVINFPKLDWQINSRNHASIQYNRMRWDSPAGIQTQSVNNYAVDSFGNDYVKIDWGVFKLNTFLTANIANEARFAYGRDFEFENSQTTSTAYEKQFLVTPPGASGAYPPQISIAGSTGFTLGTPSFLERPSYPDERTQQFADTVTWTHGNHNFRFGVDYVRHDDLAKNLRYQYGGYSYSTLTNYLADYFNWKNGLPSTTGGGPYYSNYQQAFGPLGFQFSTNDFAGFVQDDWKVNPRLTLNVGLRYEYEKLPDPFSNLIVSDIPQTGKLPSDKNNIGPRIGFAYDAFGNGRTVLRGGWGIYFGRIINSTIYNALVSTGSPSGQLNYFFTASSTSPAFPGILNSQPTSGGSKPSSVYFDHNFQNPQIHELDLDLQQDVGWNTVVTLSYIGSLGRQLPNFIDTNIDTVNGVYPITYNVVDTAGAGPLKSPTYTTLQYTRRLNKNYGAITDIFSGVSSSYHAATAQVNHTMRRGLQFQANYTYAHALDYNQNSSTFSDTNDVLDPTNPRLDYGNSNTDVRHRGVVSMIWQPTWRSTGPLSYLVNGWEFAPIFQAQTGLPYSLTTSGTPAQFLNIGGTLTRVSGLGSNINGSGGGTRLPEIGRNTYRYPNTQVFDVRAAKRFTLMERYKLELSGDAFNLLNHVNYTAVNNTGYNLGAGTKTAAPTLTYPTNAKTGLPTFGSRTAANSNFVYSPRQIQLGIRLEF